MSSSGKLNRNRQMWLLIVGCLIFFGALLFVIPAMTFRLWWQIMAVGVVAGVCTVATFQSWLSRVLTRREGVVKLIDRVTGGDLALSAGEIQTTTQSARMAASMRGLVTNLERTIRRFGQLANDVTRASEQISGRTRILARSASDQLASTESTSASVTQIDQSINNVRQNMEELSANAEETSTSVLEMSASIEEVSRIADTLADFVEQTSTAIEEMVASINEVATNTESFSSFATQTAASMVQMNATTEEIRNSARQSSELSRYVADAATEGRTAVSGTVEGMRNIQISVEEAKSALSELAERSQEIGDIVRVIDDIAGQTNLLALNAAIIAAQAGERGRGFAVVADEIRDLSERTSVSTEEIRTLIQNVQNGVSRAAEQMTLGADRVGDGVILTERASQVLEKILDLTGRSTSSIAEIARATEEQARGSQAAVSAIEEVTKMVQQTATATQQQSQTSRKIGEQASMVRDYTKHLKRAMSEQETGSRAISRAMENIMTLVQNVLESTSILASESSAIVKSMDVIKHGSRESSFSVGDLSQMANTLNHESGLLRQELDRFDLPVPTRGGSIATATVLAQRLTLDPAFAYASALVYMSKAIHAKLVKYGEGAELMPELAERWDVFEQGHRYRFHLRRDVRFHNGRTFEARDVYETFVRLLHPETKASGAWTLMNVLGAKDVAEGRTRDLKGVVIQDPYTIDIELEEPIAFFLSLLTMPETSIVPIEEARDTERYRLRGTGLGAFRVAEAIEGSRVRIVRHEGYFVSEEPFVDEVLFRLDLRSFRDAADAFVRGELDVVHGVPPRMARELKSDSRYAAYLLTTVQSHTSYVGYDSSSAPYDRVEVRRAINHAINRERMNEQVYAGMNLIAQSILPPGLLGYDQSVRGYAYDPERARGLLAKAGLAGGFEVEYRTWDSDEFRNSGLVDLLVDDLAAVGIRVNITMHSATEASGPRKTRGHGLLYCANWYADFPDPDNFFYTLMHSAGNAVRGLHFGKPEIDVRVMEARRVLDAEERGLIYRELNEMAVREAPLAPLFHERLFVLHKPSVRGVRTSLVPPPVRYEQIWIEKE